MSDDRGPVFRRPASHQDRDVYRAKTPPAVPEFVSDEVTGRCEGEDLQRARSRRPTPERIDRLEKKHDELVSVVTETRLMVSNMSGKLDVLPKLVDAVQASAERSAKRADAEHADSMDARKTRRALLAKILGAGLAGGAIGKILHMLGVL